MRHSSNERPRRQWPVKTVATDEIWRQHCLSLLCLTVATDNADGSFHPLLLSNIVATGNTDVTMPIATLPAYIRRWT
jgi:hypothetical protein